MENLIDSSVWIDYLRPATSEPTRRLAREAIDHASAVICEPIWFELLRLCPKPARKGLEVRLATLPLLRTPADLWRSATAWGQQCQDAGVQAGFGDLLIGTICRHHSAIMITFDKHFLPLSKIIGFKVNLLARPASPS